MPTSTFQEQGTVTLVASLPEERRCQSRVAQAPRVCWTIAIGHVRVTSTSPLSPASLARAPLDRVPRWCEKNMAPVFSCFVRSLQLKSEAWKTRYLWAQSATPKAMWHPRPRAEECPLQNGCLSAGKLTDTATGITVDEKQLISWARTNRSKYKNNRCQFRSWSSKSPEAKMMPICCSWQKIALRRSSSVAHLHARLGSRLKNLGQQSRSPSLCLIFTRRLLSHDCKRRWTTQLATHGAAPKSIGREVEKKVSGRRFKAQSVGLVEPETFFCLA